MVDHRLADGLMQPEVSRLDKRLTGEDQEAQR